MKERIEEASENHQKGGYEWQNEKRKSFTAGAKSDAARDYWFEKFQEQDKKKYSEEDMLDFANWCRILDNKHHNRVITIQQLFKQFKKTEE